MQGIITDIHRSSVVDGPGIRTTVFLKGCPLSCIWCHNPETRDRRVELAFNVSKCDRCADCLPACSHSALKQHDGAIEVDTQLCAQCLECVASCPTEALFSYGRSVTVEEMVHEVLKDSAYYERSGGGVTVSGGEPMMQASFTLELLRACKAKQIHACLDTSGIGREEDYRRSLDYVDLYLFDYKATDPQQHRDLTGAPLSAVLSTLDFLRRSGARVRLRCPLVPGVNDDEAHLRQIAELSRSEPAFEGVDLLCWHTMGAAKYHYLGQPIPAHLPTENTSDVVTQSYIEFMARHEARGVSIH